MFISVKIAHCGEYAETKQKQNKLKQLNQANINKSAKVVNKNDNLADSSALAVEVILVIQYICATNCN